VKVKAFGWIHAIMAWGVMAPVIAVMGIMDPVPGGAVSSRAEGE